MGALGWPRGLLLYYLLCLNFILPLRGPALTEGRKESTSDFFGARRGAPGATKGSWHYVFNGNHEFVVKNQHCQNTQKEQFESIMWSLSGLHSMGVASNASFVVENPKSVNKQTYLQKTGGTVGEGDFHNRK